MTGWLKRPTSPPQPLKREDGDTLSICEPLWRVHRTSGDHVTGWNTLRSWGPSASCRWEPHPEPPAEHADEGVLYASTDLATALVEVFQATRRVDPYTGRPKATSWTPTRSVNLLALTDDWLLRNGASAALPSGPLATCRAWARAIRRTWPDLDGLWTASTLTGRPNVTLWAPAVDTFPDLPAFSEYLVDDLLWDRVDRIAYRYRVAGYRIL